MKIKLNENEVYEIQIPDEITLAELPMITSRFNLLEKSFSKIIPINEVAEITTHEKEYKQNVHKLALVWKYLQENREVYVQLLNSYLLETPFEFEQRIKRNPKLKGLTRENCKNPNFRRLKEKEYHNVNPNEIGLIKFPSVGESAKSLRITSQIANKDEWTPDKDYDLDVNENGNGEETKDE